jgi:CO/xanthine dehydrogenase FAD-binding subunit
MPLLLGPAAYRTKMAGVMLKRALARAKSRAAG